MGFLHIVRSDLTKSLGCFDYFVVIRLPIKQEAACFVSLYQTFIVRGWVVEKFRTIHVEELLSFIDGVRYASLDEVNIGSEVGNMVFFLGSCLD